MKRNFVLIAAFALTAFGSSASACCLFPFFPTYSAGYPSFGVARPFYPAGNFYSASFAPSYGYSGVQAFSGNSCGTGCCNTGYTANYPSFAAPSSFGQYNAGCGQCNSGCGQCNTGCSQCASGFGSFSGCANGNCAGSDCIGTEIRSRPEPDMDFDRQDRRTFDNEDGRNRDERDDLDYDRRTPDNSPRSNPMDDDSFGRSDSTDSRNDWNPSESDRRDFGGREVDPLENGSRRTDPMADPLGGDDLNGGRRTPGFDGFEPSTDFLGRKPAIDGGAIDEGTNPLDEAINRSSRKPPISAPVGEETAPLNLDRDPTDVLPKADNSDSQTTSLREGRSFVRLAGHSSYRPKPVTSKISSSNSKQRAPRWISLPAPVGRVRL
ncbi:MAG: hypothetical protein ABJZ55_23110 [Fuerstiella sp.]